MIACLLKNEPASVRMIRSNSILEGGVAKASLKRRITYHAADPKPGELTMSRVNVREI